MSYDKQLSVKINNNVFSCPVCLKTFNKRFNANRHVQLLHQSVIYEQDEANNDIDSDESVNADINNSLLHFHQVRYSPSEQNEANNDINSNESMNAVIDNSLHFQQAENHIPAYEYDQNSAIAVCSDSKHQKCHDNGVVENSLSNFITEDLIAKLNAEILVKEKLQEATDSSTDSESDTSSLDSVNLFDDTLWMMMMTGCMTRQLHIHQYQYVTMQ